MLRRGNFLLLAAASVITVSNKFCPASNTARMCTTNAVRFTAVDGFAGKTNDIVYCPKQPDQLLRLRLVFFGGDTQDYPEEMKVHRDNHRYVQWNLVDTAVLMRGRFPSTDVFVIRPKRMHLKSFSCYDNFVVGNDFGVPDHVGDNGALRHLRSLLINVLALIDNGAGASGALPAEDVPLALVGFSKGCVVLNQFLYELHLAETDAQLKEFVSNIVRIYWLDGGHSGGYNLWITKNDILKRLADTGIQLHVAMTPYQLNDERRPWLRKEVKKFTETLRKLRANISYEVLFKDEEVHDIEMHFKVLQHFET